jgi:hypothetical protein
MSFFKHLIERISLMSFSSLTISLARIMSARHTPNGVLVWAVGLVLSAMGGKTLKRLSVAKMMTKMVDEKKQSVFVQAARNSIGQVYNSPWSNWMASLSQMPQL